MSQLAWGTIAAEEIRRGEQLSYVPGADVTGGLFDHFVSPQPNRWRHREAKRLGGLEVYDELVTGRKLDGQITRISTSKDAIDVSRRVSVLVNGAAREARAVEHQAAAFHAVVVREYRGEAIAGCQFSNQVCVQSGKSVG